MKLDPIQQIVALRQSLQREKTTLESRLSRINHALGAISAVERTSPGSKPKPAKAARKIKNKLSLRQAIIALTKTKPLTKSEILAGVKKLGYVFGTPKPLGSLNAILYGHPKFKNSGGKFSPP